MKYSIKYSGPHSAAEMYYGTFESNADAIAGMQSAIDILGGGQVSEDGLTGVFLMNDMTPRVLQVIEIQNLEDLY